MLSYYDKVFYDEHTTDTFVCRTCYARPAYPKSSRTCLRCSKVLARLSTEDRRLLLAALQDIPTADGRERRMHRVAAELGLALRYEKVR